MATVTRRQIGDGAQRPQLRLTADGYVATEVWMVADLSGPPDAREYEAITATGINRGTPHPAVPGVYADEIVSAMIDNSKARVSVTYRPLTSQTFPPSGSNSAEESLGASVETQQTNRDSNGAIITVSADVQTEDENGNLITETVTQEVTVERQVPHPVARFRRRETASPYLKALEYVGKVNGVSWGHAGPRQWLCSRIEGVSTDGGDTYDVTYEFHHRESSWDIEVVFIDPETGLPPDGLVDGVGRKTVQVYGAKAFASLGL